MGFTSNVPEYRNDDLLVLDLRYVECIRLLAERGGCNLRHRDNEGMCALHWASIRGHLGQYDDIFYDFSPDSLWKIISLAKFEFVCS